MRERVELPIWTSEMAEARAEVVYGETESPMAQMLIKSLVLDEPTEEFEQWMIETFPGYDETIKLADSKPCGDCLACCKAPTNNKLGKPPGVWCQYAKIGSGCRIYDQRPVECRTFNCVWKATQLGVEFRPDQCKVMVAEYADGEVTFYELAPNAFKSRKARLLMSFAMKAGKKVSLLPYEYSTRSER